VLPLWHNQLLVTLGGGHVALLYRTGLTKKILAQRESVVNTTQEHTWIDALQVLDRLLSDMAIPANTKLNISLASDLVRYLVLPASYDEINQTDKLAYAQAAFREVFGAESSNWTIQYDDAAPSKPTVCAAIDQALLDTLYAFSAKKSLALKSVQPFFVSAMNALNAHLSKLNGIVVIVEDSRLILATLEQGSCKQLRSQPLVKDWQTQLPEILTRAALLEDDVVRNVAVYAPAFKASTLYPIQDWQFKRLGLSAKHSTLQTPYAMLEVMA
jgi:hypothetical protein